MNNLPIIVPKTTRATISKQQSTTNSRNRDPNVQWKSASRKGDQKLEGNTSNAAERESDNGDELAVVKAQLGCLRLKNEEKWKRHSKQLVCYKLKISR